MRKPIRPLVKRRLQRKDDLPPIPEVQPPAAPETAAPPDDDPATADKIRRMIEAAYT